MLAAAPLRVAARRVLGLLAQPAPLRRRHTDRKRYVALVIVAFVASRIGYAWGLGVAFNASTLDSYMQYVDPVLLRTDLLRSLYYLREQPPLFNLFIGLVLRAFPTQYATAFHAAYLCAGLAGALAIYALARRLRASPRWAAVVAIGLSCSPCAVLYENWLFYAHPIAILWVFAVLALHRLLADPTRGRAFAATGVVMLLVLTRGTLHLVVYLALVAAIVALRRPFARAILVGAALPTLIVVAVYAKHAIVFDSVVIGGYFRGVNLWQAQAAQLDVADLAEVERADAASGGCPLHFNERSDFDALIAAGSLEHPRARGVPVLDDPFRSTGFTNWNYTGTQIVGRQCEKQAAWVHQRYPWAYRKAVQNNAGRFFLPADQAFPFLDEQGDENAARLRSLNHWVDKWVALQPAALWGSAVVIAGVVLTFLVPLLGVVRQRRRWKARRLRPSAEWLVSAFGAALLTYQGAVVILVSSGDHNRYRAEVMPVVWVIVIAAIARLVRVGPRFRRFRRSQRPSIQSVPG